MRRLCITVVLSALSNWFAGCLCFTVVSESSEESKGKLEVKYATVRLYFSPENDIYLYDTSPNRRARELRERRIEARKKNQLQHSFTPLEEIDEAEYLEWIEKQYERDPEYYKRLEEAQKHKYDFLSENS